ncbi:MAG: histone deacetylase [Planctomycetota bacterium]
MKPLFAYHPIEQQHSWDGHPEHRGRLSEALRLIQKDGILHRFDAVPVEALSLERLQRVHPLDHIAAVQELAENGGGFIDADTYVAPQSDEAALMAAGALAGLVEAVMQGKARRGMSIMRPPGHHALANQAMGFCIFANVAIAARLAVEELGARRVLIVDWDVHHGNGTESILYEDPEAAFFSTHQYPFYPGTGALEDIGAGEGKGYNLNVPLPPGVGDAGYCRVFDEILKPYALHLEPDLILVSAGYDAHWRDPLANEALSLAGFAALTRKVMALADELCDGRLVLALEGGYNLEVLPHAILNTLKLLENPDIDPPDPFGEAPREDTPVDSLVAKVIALHRL